MYSRPSAFGPPVGGGPSASLENSSDLFPLYHRGFYGDSRFGYYPHVTPPYYDGQAWVDLEYNPGLHSEAGLPDLPTLLSRLTASYLRFAGPLSEGAVTHLDQTQLWRHGLGGRWTYEDKLVVPLPGPMSGAYECNQNSMQVSASVNLFGSTKGLSDILRYQGVAPFETEEQWVIQTKFETPILNFIDNSGSDGSTADGISQLTEDFATTQVSGGYYTRPIGMWHQLGRIPKGNEGVYLEISDVPAHQSQMFPERTTAPSAGVTWTTTGSLADLVGFKIASQKLGKIANTKTIREAVVAVPFVEKEVTTTMPGPMGSTQEMTYNQKQFFSIDKAQIEYLTGITQSPPAAPPGQSVIDMVLAMQRYVFPPSMDFITYPDDVNPISMYIFEFTHTLNRDDLMHIWQNLPPRIARTFDQLGGGVLPDSLHTQDIVQTKTITHPLQSGELLPEVDEKLQWMVFKVKQRAQTNYFRKVVAGNAGVSPSTLPPWARPAHILDAVADGAGRGAVSKTDPYLQTYNWPYDFFSLVELVKINEQVTFQSVERSAGGAAITLPFGDTGPPPLGRPSAQGGEESGNQGGMMSTATAGESGETIVRDMPPGFQAQPQTAVAAPIIPSIPNIPLSPQTQTTTTTIRRIPTAVLNPYATGQSDGTSGYQGSSMLAPTDITTYDQAISPFKSSSGPFGLLGGGGGYGSK